jgi:hypothetical protein
MALNNLRLSRAQIAKIVGNDPEAIKQFEKLFTLNQDYLVSGAVDDTTIDAGNALAAAGAALDRATDLESRIATLEVAPVAQPVIDARRGRTVTASAVYAADDYFIAADCTAGVVTLTLPTAAGSRGKVLVAKKIDASINAMNLNGAGADTIDGAGSVSTTTQYVAFTVFCDGAQWWLV